MAEENDASIKIYVASAMDLWVDTIKKRMPPKEDTVQNLKEKISEGKKLLARIEAENDSRVCRNQAEMLKKLLKVVSKNHPEGVRFERLRSSVPDTIHENHYLESCNGDCAYFDCNCLEDLCGKCYKLVKYTDKGVDCSTCGTWYHLNCCHALTEKEYNRCNLLQEEFDWDCNKCKNKGQPQYGHIKGIDPGVTFETRKMCAEAGVHGMFLRGIHFGKEGAYAICVNGGYEDNMDGGDCIIYTGEGGRIDSRNHGSRQVLHQERLLRRGNKALQTSQNKGRDVRVIRGPKSGLVPGGCYRYDGLYKVTDHVYTRGKDGFYVHKFFLERKSEQKTPQDLEKSLKEASERHPKHTVKEKFEDMKSASKNAD